MKQYESEHYIFNYNAGSKAEADLVEIAAHQEACFSYICGVLQVNPDFKLEYFLCDTPEEVGRVVYGDDEPCNGFAAMPNKVYAVYNEKTQCIGFHEDAHLISFTVNRPGCPAIHEGLAMYFDRKWWDIQNLDWVSYFLSRDMYLPVDKLLDREAFFDADCSITYPVMGAFTDYLITTYGIGRYMEMYRQHDMTEAMKTVYGKSPAQLNDDFVSYVRLFRVDEVLEKRMEELLE